MAFIAAAVIGTVGAVAGGALAAKGARDASKTAAAGGAAEIAYNKETRDLIRKDQAPYRKAGYKALDALMSLTGLGGGAQPNNSSMGVGAPDHSSLTPLRPDAVPVSQRVRQSAYGRDQNRYPIRMRAAGGNTIEGEYYNINELGPESVYSGGEYTRTPNPRTISGTEGYVQPNIQGRALGGAMGNATMGAMGVGGPYGGLPDRQPGRTYPNPNNQTGWSGGFGNGTNLHFGGYQGNLAEDQANPQVSNYIQDRSTTAINPQTGYPNENPGGEPGGYQFETDPGYQFRFSEGMRALDRGAAARGGLLSGGYARKAIRYGQGFASNEFSNVYNRIANIAGLGQTANQTNAQSALYTGAAMGNAASNAANASAYGQIGAGNAWANAGNQIAQLPWGNVFQPKTANNTAINNTPN